MRVITESRLVKFWEKHSDAEISLRLWRKLARLAHWQNFVELRQVFSSADQVGKLTVFNIGGNKYRLIARVDYNRQIIYIRNIFTHAEYDRGDWKSDSWLKE
ncbi:MAG: type II toxin-antitoxin system HigB family toxin [Tildeniella nuda ZEHNDER 1965/U140]|nr:type II toxin-antitoxin system HigB family toxin [Tildeniella nuda ZEHNDER 1965/U140]